MSIYRENEDGSITMPTNEEITKQMMDILELIELAETGHLPAMEQCVGFFKQTIMQAASMLDDPGLQAAVKRAVAKETGKTVVDAPSEG